MARPGFRKVGPNPNPNAKRERTYKAELPPKGDLPENGSITGTFQNARQVTITDRETHKEKEVWQYTFRDKDGNKFALLGAFQLDAAFEEVFENEGGLEACMGLNMRINRGKNVKVPGNKARSMGTYEISVWEE